MLCYLPWDVKVVVNDINGNLTNLYMVIRDKPSELVSKVMKLLYSEVVFQKCYCKWITLTCGDSWDADRTI